ncbi:LysR family transcriptional regulator [Franconibacter helveticus 513]|uniref:HTH lysR-type domain-containing protein n=3 Tax=Franconibacter helveticus TaxID=357240 RepID=C7C579_9ENTR|nr:hypothetical protein [Franconibacter helveticus]
MARDNETNLLNIMQIRAFCQVAKRGSVSQAANDLFRTQSAITRSIRDLEHVLSVPLFERHFSGMVLTDYGKCILPRAQHAIEELNAVPLILARLKNKENKEFIEPIYLFNARRLEIFLQLYHVNHTQTVANLLNITQPAVSAALKTLEKGSGFALFRRTPEGVMPGQAATLIYPNLSRCMNELQHIYADIAARRGVLEGVVRIGALPLSRTRLLPQAVSAFLAAHPGIQVLTNESPFDALVSEMRAGNIDFILGALRNTRQAPDLASEVLFEEEMVILARNDHPLHKENALRDGLAQARWVLPRAGTPARLMLDAAFTALGVEAPRPVVETGDLAMVRGLLLHSDMLAAVSKSQLAWELEAGVLTALPVALPQTRRDIGLTFRAGSLPSPATEALLGYLRRCAREETFLYRQP